MFTRYFIDRPIFANVIAVITIILGVIALRKLPIEQYPPITPPTVRVSTSYPGANAQVVADTVAAPLEQQINGVEGSIDMQSVSSADGGYNLIVTFEIGTNLDQAQVLVQNRIAIAEPNLPEQVRRQGITVKKQATNILVAVALTSPDQSWKSLELANYANLRLRDEFLRIPGVGDVSISGGSAYGMRVWLDPEKLKGRNLTAMDVVNSLREQNVQVAAGLIGQAPIPSDQAFQYTVTALGRLSDPEEFGKIVIKSDANIGLGGVKTTRLEDVARIELGGQSYDIFASRDGLEAANLLIFQLPGSNALEVAQRVRERLEQLKKNLPPGIEVTIPFDTTAYVYSAIEAVYRTLIEAGLLVLIVILVFLQSWRALLVPATTVPVTLIGGFAFMPILDFTINLLTLFGLVLAIGIVVDDAIVIVENAAHHVERGLPPREATIKAMSEVTGPIIGITAVLLAVFVPTAFIGGITGEMYRQFALTIAATAVISAINAVTLKPAQCAVWLRRPPQRRNLFVRAFNALYDLFERLYAWTVGKMLTVAPGVMILFLGIVALSIWWFQSLPTGFLPIEDQGYVVANVQLPDNASLERTRKLTARIDGILKETPGVKGWFVQGGLSRLDNSNAPNMASIFIVFDPIEKRKTPDLQLSAILQRLNKEFSEIQEANIVVFPPPVIRGLGLNAGFAMQIEDRDGVGQQALLERVREIVDAAKLRPEVTNVNSTFRGEVPQLFVDIDRVKVKSHKLRLESVYDTLNACLGSVYVNDFNKFGRTYQVRVQADAPFRRRIEDIGRLEVRNSDGRMVPLGTVLVVREVTGPPILTRYNMYPVAVITGAPAQGFSSSEALAIMEQIAEEKLPPSMDYEWSGIAMQEKRIGNEPVYMLILAVVMVYLVLAAQYESWLLPLAVIFVVPLGMLGSTAATVYRGYENNIYTQIGVVLIIALASKNAILIVEFARDLRAHGKCSIRQAAMEAARMRLRPILMTSFAFILGVVPLVTAEGAGATGQRALGTAVFGGMLASTLLAIFVVPVFYVVFQWMIEYRNGPPKPMILDNQQTPSSPAIVLPLPESKPVSTPMLPTQPLVATNSHEDKSYESLDPIAAKKSGV